MAISRPKGSPQASSPAANPATPTGHLRHLWKFLVPVAIGIVLWFLPAPAGLETKAWHMFAVFVATIAGIMTAPLPMSAVAIIGATAGVLVGVVSFADVTKSTGTDLVWLVMLAFFISRGVIKTGLGRRIALLFMRLLGKRTIGLGYGLALTELLISPAMPSITARAGGVMLPITRAMAEVLGSHADDPQSQGKVGSSFHAAVSLGVLSNVNGCLTQYGIGSGPVMFGAGYVTQGQWWRAGFLMSLIYMVVWLVVGPLWWKLLGQV